MSKEFDLIDRPFGGYTPLYNFDTGMTDRHPGRFVPATDDEALPYLPREMHPAYARLRLAEAKTPGEALMTALEYHRIAQKRLRAPIAQRLTSIVNRTEPCRADCGEPAGPPYYHGYCNICFNHYEGPDSR